MIQQRWTCYVFSHVFTMIHMIYVCGSELDLMKLEAHCNSFGTYNSTPGSMEHSPTKNHPNLIKQET
jgi:hypothetical protein